MTIRLSENFTLEEFTETSTGLPNVPGPPEREKLLYVTNYILQPVRERWGRVRVTSGFRSPEVNASIGGSPKSQHMRGEAVDFIPLETDLAEVYRWIVTESGISFGQCILEDKGGKRWIHASLVSFDKRGEALVFDGRRYTHYV